MRIPGAALRTPITIQPALGNTGDGDTYGPAETFKADVVTRAVVTGDAAGQTLAAWSRLRMRPDTTVTGATGPRRPTVGDQVTVDGLSRLIRVVQPVYGPGATVAYLEVTAGAVMPPRSDGSQ